MAVLTLGLAACAGTEVRDETPGLANQAIPSAIRTQNYTPSGIGATSMAPTGTAVTTLRAEQAARAEQQPAAPERPVAQEQPAAPERPAAPPPRARRGSSSPPPSNLYTSPPVIPTPNPTTDRAITDFKLDQLRNNLDRQRAEDAMRPPDLFQQHDLMNRRFELDRMNMQR
ncbi:MAG TPA: hypothetical protein VD978_12460 [Azospirillum sp.]|nr:hypothetical protein [Azospirillum sp.]